MRLSAIMKRAPLTLKPMDTLVHARDFMAWGQVNHMPVLAPESGDLVGILSGGDIARHWAEKGLRLSRREHESVHMAMSHFVCTAAPEDSVHMAAKRMAADRVGCLPITEEGRLVGIVTLHDMLLAEVKESASAKAPKEPLVEHVMSQAPHSVHPDDQLLDAAARMLQYRVRHLPVVDGECRVIGMLFDRDVRASVGEPSLAFLNGHSAPAERLRVSDAMRFPPAIAKSEQTCVVAAKALADAHENVAAVTNEDEVLVGVVSYVDLLRVFSC